MNKFRFCVIILLITLVNVFSSERLNENIWKIKESGKLNVSTLNFDYFPWIYTNDEGELTGIDVILINELAKTLKVKPVFHRICSSYTDMVNYVNSDSIDLGIGILSKTVDRELNSLQSAPYFNLDIKVLIDRIKFNLLGDQVFDKNDIIDVINDKNLKIGIVAPSWYVEFAKKIIPEATMVHYSKSDKMLEGLLTKKVDAVLTHDVDLKFFFNDHPERELYYILHTLPFIDRLCMQINKDKPDLLNLVNVFLQSNNNPYLNYNIKEALDEYILEKDNIDPSIKLEVKNADPLAYLIFFISVLILMIIFLILRKLKFSDFTTAIFLYGGVLGLAIYAGYNLKPVVDFLSIINHLIIIFLTVFVFLIIFTRIIINYECFKNTFINHFLKVLFYISAFSICFILLGVVLSELMFDESMINRINFNSSNLNLSNYYRNIFDNTLSFPKKSHIVRFSPLIFLLFSYIVGYSVMTINKGKKLLFDFITATYNLSYKVIQLLYKALPLFLFTTVGNYILFYEDNFASYSLFLTKAISISLILSLIIISMISFKLKTSIIETLYLLKKILLIGLTTGLGILTYPEIIKVFSKHKILSIKKLKFSLPVFFIVGSSVSLLAILFTFFGALNFYNINISLYDLVLVSILSFFMVFVLGGVFSFNSIVIANIFFATVITVPEIGIFSIFSMVFNTLYPFTALLHVLVSLYCGISVSDVEEDEPIPHQDKFDQFFSRKIKENKQKLNA